jgi:hypothetical protein
VRVGGFLETALGVLDLERSALLYSPRPWRVSESSPWMLQGRSSCSCSLLVGIIDNIQRLVRTTDAVFDEVIRDGRGANRPAFTRGRFWAEAGRDIEAEPSRAKAETCCSCHKNALVVTIRVFKPG